MPRRYGKVTRFVLLNLYLRDAYSVADLATKERKALRQMQRARLKALQAAVKAGLADSAAGRYTNFNSLESLSKHLKSLAAKAIGVGH